MPSRGLDVETNGSSRGELLRDEAWRYERVSVSAYYYAKGRGFEPGGETEDWRLAEAQIDAADEAGE
jgi:hypothetical protein